MNATAAFAASSSLLMSTEFTTELMSCAWLTDVGSIGVPFRRAQRAGRLWAVTRSSIP